jgi:glycerol-3-phosphate dehydrogenase (NAD(P)+)
VGERLGKGEKLDAIVSSMQMVAEGVWNAQVVCSMAKEFGVEMPISEVVRRLCHEDLPASEAIGLLMNRPIKDE